MNSRSWISIVGLLSNLLFTARRSDTASLERRIAKRFGTGTFVRTGAELGRIVAGDPFQNSVLFLAQPPSAARRRAFRDLAFEEPRPVLEGTTLYFVYPARQRGKRASFDFEHALGVLATARSARVVGSLLARMSEASVGSQHGRSSGGAA
jgi:hypothetical protein